MPRISSLFVATTLAILPISAFAQQNAATPKTTTPSSTVNTAPATTTVPGGGQAVPGTVAKTGTTASTVMPTDTKAAQPAKPGLKTDLSDKKTEVHGMNAVKSHDGKTSVPAASKTAEPTKS